MQVEAGGCSAQHPGSTWQKQGGRNGLQPRENKTIFSAMKQTASTKKETNAAASSAVGVQANTRPDKHSTRGKALKSGVVPEARAPTPFKQASATKPPKTNAIAEPRSGKPNKQTSVVKKQSVNASSGIRKSPRFSKAAVPPATAKQQVVPCKVKDELRVKRAPVKPTTLPTPPKKSARSGTTKKH